MRNTKFLASASLVVMWMLLASVQLFAAEVERRGIKVQYDYQHTSDGFGNIRTVTFKGIVRNTNDQDASIVQITYKLYWQRKNSVSTKKLSFENMLAGELQEFQFDIDLADQPDILDKIIVEVSKIKFSTVRKPSAPSVHNVITEQVLSLQRLTEEGRVFAKIVQDIPGEMPFVLPVKDEFETTDEYESNVNFAENDHFTKSMDLLEKMYGEQVGGKGSLVRFLPRNLRKKLIYLSESHIKFQIPVRLGQYNADVGRYEFVNLAPRTLPFQPKTYIIEASMAIAHEDGLFFLKNPQVDVSRETAKIWRKNDNDLVIEMDLQMGVYQDGPFPVAYCYIGQIKLLNTQTKEIYRQWIAASP